MPVDLRSVVVHAAVSSRMIGNCFWFSRSVLLLQSRAPLLWCCLPAPSSRNIKSSPNLSLGCAISKSDVHVCYCCRKMPVAVPDGCLLVQAGKQLERLTGGHVLAGFHEVRCIGPSRLRQYHPREVQPYPIVLLLVLLCF